MEGGEEYNSREAAIVQTWLRLEDHETTHPEHPYATVLHLRVSQPKATISELAQEFSERAGAPVSPEAFRKVLQNARRLFMEIFTGLWHGGP